MLIYKQKCTNDKGKQWYTKALKVGNIAWLHDNWQDFDKREEEKDIKGSYWKYLFSYAEISPKNDEFRLPTEEDIASTNVWLQDKENLQAFKDFFHIVNDKDENDQFWVIGKLPVHCLGSLASDHIETNFPSSEGIEDRPNGLFVLHAPQAQGHIIVPVSECEEIPD